jgi:hypothetical protein
MTSIPASVLDEGRRQHAILSHGTAAIYPGPDHHGLDGLHYKLATSLTTNRPLKVKFGMDPTAGIHRPAGLVIGVKLPQSRG